MSFLLDTNVLSEWVKPVPNPGVLAWAMGVDEDNVFLSVVTLAELRHGIERMAAGTRRERLDLWLRDELPARFGERVLQIDPAVADNWGRMLARGQASGRPMGAMDACIAATAEVHDLVLVTRNVSDFGTVGIEVLNPWTGS